MDRFINKKVKSIFSDDNKVLFCLCVLIFGALFFALNYLTPLNNADDQKYKYIIGIEKITEVSSIWDIIISQTNHYCIWGGRSIVHAIAQFFLMYDKIVFNVANTIILIILLLDIYYMAANKKISIKMWIVACCITWFSVPGIGNILWLTGACNYLWGTAIEILFFSIYYFDIKNAIEKKSDLQDYSRNNKHKLKNVSKSFITALFIGVFGVIAGWTLEAGGITMIIGIILIVLYGKGNGYTIKIWNISGIIGSFIGYMIMILAPGNFARMNTIDSEILNRSFIDALIHRLGRESYGLVLHLGVAFSAFAIIMALYCVEKKSVTWKQIVVDNIDAFFFCGLALFAVYVMTISVSYSMRVLVTPAFYMVAAVLSALNKNNEKIMQPFLNVCVICMVIMAGLQYITAIWAMIYAEPHSIINIHISYFGADYFD